MKRAGLSLVLMGAVFLAAQDVAVEEFGVAEVVLAESQRAFAEGSFAVGRAKAERAIQLAGDDARLAERAAGLAAECACFARDRDAAEVVLAFLRQWPGSWDAQPAPECVTGLLRGALKKKIGWLRFDVLPTEAALTIAGRSARASAVLTAPAGGAVLRLSAPGFQPFTLEVQVAAGRESLVSLPWKAVARPLRLFIKPDGARVFLNGVEVGVAAPVVAGSVEASGLHDPAGWGFLETPPRAFGNYLLRADAPCFEARTLEIHVPETGAPAPLSLAPVTLDPLEVPLELDGPLGGLVSVDGILIGKTGESLSLCGGRHHLSVAWPEGVFGQDLDVRERRAVKLRVAPRWSIAFLGVLNRRPGLEHLPTLEQQWQEQLPGIFMAQNLLFPPRTTQVQTLLQALLDSPQDARAEFVARLSSEADLFLFGEALEGSAFKAGRVHFVSRDGLLESFDAPALDRAGGLWSEVRRAAPAFAGQLPGQWRLTGDGWRVVHADGVSALQPGDLLLAVAGRPVTPVRDLGAYLAAVGADGQVSCKLQRGTDQVEATLPVTLHMQLPAPGDVPRPRLVVRASARFAAALPGADRDAARLLEGLALFSLGEVERAVSCWKQVTSQQPGALNRTTANYLVHLAGQGPAPAATDPPGALDRPGGFPVPRS